MIPYETGSRDVARAHWRHFFVDGSETRVSRSVSHFLFFFFVLGFLRLRGDFSYDDDARVFLHLIDGGLSSPRAQDDVLHCRHPWVFGVQEEIERLTKRVKESEEVILLVAKLNKQIDTLEEHVQDLTVTVHVLEKLCFD
ncbi:hypothetical protein Bca52824_040379 [Brassica carinata]|uniref:Uncharacterized protein n=1 Tax=Brassica carinata TaxID=52824 RepID=A0A8X7RVE4_BRACI|nr:hypothetical protein Bca52824_040379 [Brassica carinata]